MRDHKRPAAVTLVIVLALWGLSAAQTRPAQAQSTAPETHATAEKANCIAQGKCPTDTPTASPTATATWTASPRPAPSPSATPVPIEPTDDPPPALSVPAPGANPIGGYLRPSTGSDPRLLELAVRQGRWDIGVLEGCASPPEPWTNVWLFTPQGGLPSVANADFFADYDPVLLCPIASASWHSDTPCAQDQEQDTCDVERDGGYWEARGEDPPEPTETPVPPTPIVITRVVQAAPAPAAPAAPAQVIYRDRELPTPEPEIVTVVATVLVYVPTTTPRPTLTSTAAPTLTPVPTWSAPTALALVPLPTPATPDNTQPQSSGNLGIWGAILGGLAVVGMMLWRRHGAGEEA